MNHYAPTPSRIWDNIGPLFYLCSNDGAMCRSRTAQDQGAWKSAWGKWGHLPGSELPGNTSMQALTAGPTACSTVGSGFPGSQDIEAEAGWKAQSGCGWHREQGTEYKGGWWKQERQAGGVCDSVVIHSVCQNNHLLQHVWRKSNGTVEL